MLVLRFYSGVNIFKLPLCNASCMYLSSLSMSVQKKDCSTVNALMPPLTVHRMKKLDRDLFKKEIEVPAMNVPAENLKASLKDLKPYLLKVPNLLPVQGDTDMKTVLLNPTTIDEAVKKLQIDIFWSKLTLTYDNFKHENIFKTVLPPDTAGNVSGFSIIGHIIHLNLKEELLEYKYLIGEVLLSKFKNIKTVVNKAQIIDTTYRNFQMELLAGEPDYEVTVKENGFQYAFDFSKVFWNPRLSHEHAEIVKKVESGDLIFDVFAGVGPFAIPLAKKRCLVHANDLNPDSYKWLCRNIQLNKVPNFLTAYNLDGREFIKTVVKDLIIKHWTECNESSIHVIMNLPACALEFLDAFHGLLADHVSDNVVLPIIYCYFFLKKDEVAKDVIKNYFSEDISECVDIDQVRVVAPNKRMMRLTYKIPTTVLFDSKDVCSEHVSKKIKLS